MRTCVGCIHAVVCIGYDEKKTGCEHYVGTVEDAMKLFADDKCKEEDSHGRAVWS